MALYVTQLSEEWRRGPLRSYEPVIANRTALRGKLLIAPHLRTNVLRPANFLTQADVFAEDGPTTRTLKAALSLAQRTSVNHHTLRLAGQLLADFKDVGLRRSPTCTPGLGRGQQRFESLLALAELLLSSTAPQGAGAANTYSLLFDMNVIFERYIAALLRREVCPPAFVATAQASRSALLRRGGQPVFHLRPDVAIERDGRLVGLLDTKWKALEPGRSHHGVAQADLYQAYAYAREHDCACVVLLYPGAGGLVDTYHLNPAAGPPARICVATVDLAKPHRLVARQLQDVLQQASIMPAHGAG